MLLQVNGSFDVPVGHTKLSSTQFLKVGRLSMNEELVDGRDFDVVDQTQVDSHTNLAQVMHGFFAADFFCSAKNS